MTLFRCSLQTIHFTSLLQKSSVLIQQILNPKLILADEPTGNLHSAQGEEIMQLFKALNEAGTTIIQVTHSEKNAGYGSRIINLLDGRVELT